MASSYAIRWNDPTPGQRRRRGAAMALAIAAHVLIILMLLRIVPSPMDSGRTGDSLKTFTVNPGQKDVAKRAPPKPHRQAHTAKAPHAQAPHPPTQTSQAPSVDASAIWALGKSVYKASDIAAITPAKGGGEVADSGGGGEPGDSRPVGQGPGGRSLYAAQWYREPTDAEMRTYLPKSLQPPSWAMIMCQTAPRYGVENCREIEESPPGAGLSRALRQAAWQFKVVPPRVDGKPEIGAWVRIRFDFTDGGVRVRK